MLTFTKTLEMECSGMARRSRGSGWLRASTSDTTAQEASGRWGRWPGYGSTEQVRKEPEGRRFPVWNGRRRKDPPDTS